MALPADTSSMTSTAFSIRQATQADRADLQVLAQLDSKRLADDQYTVAEMHGSIVAAVAPATGQTIADPFRRTAELVDLLRAHVGSAVVTERRHTLSVRRPALAH